MQENQPGTPNLIVFFDGVCNLCNGFVNFVIQNETAGKIHFAAIQSETAKRYLTVDERQTLSSIIVVETDTNKHLTESSAVFKVIRLMRFPWNLFSVLRIVTPSFVGNFFYQFIAKNRYRWFGKTETCRVPTESEKARFLS